MFIFIYLSIISKIKVYFYEILFKISYNTDLSEYMKSLLHPVTIHLQGENGSGFFEAVYRAIFEQALSVLCFTLLWSTHMWVSIGPLLHAASF